MSPGNEATWRNIIKKYRYALYTGLFAMCMMTMVYLLLGVWPFGDGTVLTGDLGGIYINFFSQLKRFLHGQGGFSYGFSKGLGGSLLGLYAYYYSSPFNLLYAFFSVKWFPVAASLVLFAKIVLASLFFNVYITSKFKNLGWYSVVLALCYGFMAWSFTYAQNIMWHDVLVLMPLVCIGIDRIIKGKSFVFYTVILAITIFSNFYIAYMGCIFALLYFVYSMLSRPDFKTNLTQPVMRFSVGSLLAGGINAALLIPALANINRNKGSLLSFNFSFERIFPLVRLPERFMWGSFDASDVWGQLPFIYCGIFVLVLVVCYFLRKTIPLREKLLSAAILAIFTLSFWIKGLDFIWHGLKEPIWFPGRYSFLFCFFLTLLAAKAVAAGQFTRREVIYSGSIIVAAVLVMVVFPIAVSRSRLLLSAVAALVFAMCLIYAITTKNKRYKQASIALIVLVAAGELTLNAYFITNQFDKYPLSGFQQFVDTAGASVDKVKAFDAGEYRIADGFYSNLNDPLLLGYRGISHFASTQDGYAQGVLYNLGFRNYSAAGPYLMGGTPFADGVLGMEYLCSNGAQPVPSHWEIVQDVQAPMAVYQNPYALPMMFSTTGGSDDGRTGEYEEDLFKFQNDVYRGLGGNGDLFEPQPAFLQGDDKLPLTGTVPVGSHYSMTAASDGYYYAYFHSPKFLLLPMNVNGEYRGIYFSPTYSGVVDLGYLRAGETATINWEQTADIELDLALFARINEEKLVEFVETADAHAGEFSIRDGYAAGTIHAEEGYTTLFTSIPWDEDWVATVNGRTVEIGRFAGGLITVPLQQGQNQVELRFVPAGMAIGRWVTGVFAFLFIAGCVVEKQWRKRYAGHLAAENK